MRILMAQDRPCIRNYKIATVLAERGHEVHLAAFLPEQLPDLYGLDYAPYQGVIQLLNIQELLDVAAYFDVVHCHNEPDSMAAVMCASDTPSVHDCHDMMSIRGLGFDRIEEAIANMHSDGCVYVSDYQRNQAVESYPCRNPRPKSAVVNSAVLEKHLPQKRLKKLSSGTNEPHLVYEGGMNMHPHTHRYLLPVFKSLVEAGAWVHVYGLGHPAEIGKYIQQIDNPRFVIHKPLDTPALMEALTQYDMGLCVFNITEGNRHHLESTLPNKLFEYLAAGLPVICSNLQEMVQFIKPRRCGLVWTGPEEIMELWRTAVEVYRARNVDPREYTMEKQIVGLEELYFQLSAGAQRALPIFESPTLDDWTYMAKYRSLQWEPPEGSKMIRRSVLGMTMSPRTAQLEAVVANGYFGPEGKK